MAKHKFIRDSDSIDGIRSACQVAATVLKKMKDAVCVGMTTAELDEIGREWIEKLGAESACHQYQAGEHTFPAHTCLSINEEVVHGIGKSHRNVEPSDVVSIDVVVRYNGFIGDNATTVAIAPVKPADHALLSVTEAALDYAIGFAKPGNRVGDISNAVERYVRRHNYGIVRDFVGHGVGLTMHEAPQIPNYGRRGKGALLKPGMALAIEPMVNLGSHEVRILDDGWTAVTVDGQKSAHFEHTVLVTEGEPEILTIPKN